VEGEWKGYRYDSGNTGHVPNGDGPTGEMGILWKRDYFGIGSSPVLHSGNLYLGVRDREKSYARIVALDALNGNEVWNYKPEPEVTDILATPTVGDDNIYVGDESGNIYALNGETGGRLWKETFNTTVINSVTIEDGILYIGSVGGEIHAIDAENGEVLWEFEESGRTAGVPAVSDKMVYAGFSDNGLYAIKEGNNLWSYETPWPSWISPVFTNGTVYAGGQRIHAIDSEDGNESWTFDINGVANTPAVTDENLYTMTGGYDSQNMMYSIDREDGSENWRVEIDTRAQEGPVVVDGTVYFSTPDKPSILDFLFTPKSFSAIGVEDGSDTGGLSRAFQFSTGTVVADGVAYIASRNTLYAVAEAGPD